MQFKRRREEVCETLTGGIKRRKQYFFMTTENNLRDGNGRDKAGE